MVEILDLSHFIGTDIVLNDTKSIHPKITNADILADSYGILNGLGKVGRCDSTL
jgi:hypothetical protein